MEIPCLTDWETKSGPPGVRIEKNTQNVSYNIVAKQRLYQEEAFLIISKKPDYVALALFLHIKHFSFFQVLNDLKM